MKYGFLLLICYSLLLIMVCGCVNKPGIYGSISRTEEKTWNLKYATEQSPNSYYHIYGHIPYARAIEQATYGRVKLTIYNSQTLIKSTQVFEGVRDGIAEMGWLFTGLYPGQFSFAESGVLPFLFPNAEIGGKVTWQIFSKYPEIQAGFNGVKVLAAWSTEPYFIASRSKFYKTLDDFHGQKIRVPGGPPIDFIKALDASPMVLTMPDCYLNLQRGVFDALLTPAEAYFGFKLFEVAPYVTYIPTIAMCHSIIMNLNTWNSFPKEIQEQIMSVSGETASVMMSRDVFDKARLNMHQELVRAGAKIQEYSVPPNEAQKWIDKVGQPVWDHWVRSQQKAGLTSAQKILEDTLALARQYRPQ